MGAFFDRLPVSPDDLCYLSLGALSSGQAGDLVAVFLLLLDHLAFAQIVAGTPNGDELPASAETGLFGGGLFALEAATLQPPVLLAPAGRYAGSASRPAAAQSARAQKALADPQQSDQKDARNWFPGAVLCSRIARIDQKSLVIF